MEGQRAAWITVHTPVTPKVTTTRERYRRQLIMHRLLLLFKQHTFKQLDMCFFHLKGAICKARVINQEFVHVFHDTNLKGPTDSFVRCTGALRTAGHRVLTPPYALRLTDGLQAHHLGFDLTIGFRAHHRLLIAP
jgi:hypothetical protein